jgi:hypothetical protein
MSSSYQPLPTSDRLPKRLAPKGRDSNVTHRRVLLALLLSFLAFLLFKIGQYSTQPKSPVNIPAPQKDQPCSSEDPKMPCDGKYSIG